MSLARGIYCPTLTFFKNDDDESVDYEHCAEHALYLAKAGIKGLVIHGSTGESACLTIDEKEQIIREVRKKLDAEGFQSVPIIAGISGQCLQESLNLARTAHRAGALYGIGLSPSFFYMHMTDSVLESYFTELATKSPMPILIYNFPAVTNGINMSAPLLERLANHPKIIGTKLTCNTVSKIQYLHPDCIKADFQVLTGSSEFLGAARAAGAIGAISGLANMFPYTLVKLYSLLDNGGDEKEVVRLQNLVTRFEGHMMRAFIPGNRAVLEMLGKPAGRSRKPVPVATDAEVALYKKEVVGIAEEEQKLAAS